MIVWLRHLMRKTKIMRDRANEGEMRQSCVCLINEANSKLIRIQTQPKIVWRYLVGIH